MDLRNTGYFKGWYFKCCGNGCTVAFIPAYHCDGKTETVSLQIITDDEVFNIPFDTLEFTEKPLHVELGGCTFSQKGITVHIDNDRINLYGTIRFHCISPIKYDIMGPFSIVPYMQCRHSVYSMRRLWRKQRRSKWRSGQNCAKKMLRKQFWETARVSRKRGRTGQIN